MAYTNTWTTAAPLDTQAANQGAVDFRATKLDIMQRVASFGAGLLAARPTPEATSGTADWTGVMYWATDTSQTFRWNGSSWDDITVDVTGGLPQLVASYDSIAASTILSPAFTYVVPSGKDGMYQLYCWLKTNNSGTGSATPVLIYNYGIIDGATLDLTNLADFASGVGGAANGNPDHRDFSFYDIAADTITVNVNGPVTGGSTYDVHFRLYYLG